MTEEGREGDTSRRDRNGPHPSDETVRDEAGPFQGLSVGRQEEQSGKIRGLEGRQASCLGRGGRASRLLLTAASLHDSQAAPFLLKKTEWKVQETVWRMPRPFGLSRGGSGWFPSSTKTPERGNIPMEPVRAHRYKGRMQVERF